MPQLHLNCTPESVFPDKYFLPRDKTLGPRALEPCKLLTQLHYR